MMNIKILVKSFFLAFLIFVIGSFFAVRTEAASRLYFDPASATAVQGTDFQINVQIDTSGASVFGADATITFPADGMVVKSVTNGGFFTDFSYAQSSGQLELHGFFSNLYQTKSGTGTLATVTFTALKNTGTDTAGFVCSATGSSTEIIDSNGKNILSCNSLNQLTLNYSSEQTSNQNGPTNACDGTCGSNYNCNSGLFCYQGFCRNPFCSSSTNCQCPTATPTPNPTLKPTSRPSAKATPITVVLKGVTPSPSPTPSSGNNIENSAPESSLQKISKIDPKLIAIWVGLGIIGIILIIVISRLLKKRNSSTTIPPQPPTNFGNP